MMQMSVATEMVNLFSSKFLVKESQILFPRLTFCSKKHSGFYYTRLCHYVSLEQVKHEIMATADIITCCCWDC